MMEYLLGQPESVWSSSSSDDEEYTLCINKSIEKIHTFVEEIVTAYDDATFKDHFRIVRPLAYTLIERFKNSTFYPKSNTNNKMGTSAEKAVLLTLWYLANAESFRQIVDRFNVSLSSAHRLLVKVIDFILSIRDEFIKWPNSKEKSI